MKSTFGLHLGLFGTTCGIIWCCVSLICLTLAISLLHLQKHLKVFKCMSGEPLGNTKNVFIHFLHILSIQRISVSNLSDMSWRRGYISSNILWAYCPEILMAETPWRISPCLQIKLFLVKYILPLMSQTGIIYSLLQNCSEGTALLSLCSTGLYFIYWDIYGNQISSAQPFS